ncbi:T9SS type A sorting domain-containing protein [bacterium]|nr:T9SS type A sorting domain-containing protein [bacterium]
MSKASGRKWKVTLISILAFLLILPYAFAGGDRTLSGWVTEVSEDFETVYPADWDTYAETGDYTWGRSQHEPYEGTYSIWCASKNLNGKPTRFPTGNYANNMSAWAVIGPINLQYCTEATFSFYMKYSISTNDGVGVYAQKGDHNWQGNAYSGNSNGWKRFEFDLSAWPGLGNLLGLKNVYLGFSFYSNAAGASMGAFVDSVMIKKYFTGWPDLSLDEINFTSGAHVQGQPLRITTTISNIGQNPAPTSNVQLFISKDASIDVDSDLLLGVFNFPVDLGVNESDVLSIDTKTPVVLQPANYYIGAVVDHMDVIVEEDEDNNQLVTDAASFTIAPYSGWDVVLNEDFDMKFPSGGWSRHPGNGNYSWGWNKTKPFEGDYSIWCTASNYNGVPNTYPKYGYADNADSWVEYGPFDLIGCQKADLSFVFTQQLHSGSDKVKVLVSVGGAWRGYEYNTDTYGWLYKQLDLMAWPNFGSLKDADGIKIAFNFTSNNTGHREGTFIDNVVIRRQFIMPDLVCSQLIVDPLTLQPGQELIIDNVVKNIGEKASGVASKVDLYLSTDDLITPNDDLLATNPVGELEMDEEAAFSNTVTLDAGLTEGAYFIGALVDGDDAVDETAENNNTASKQIQIVVPKPDLTCLLVMAQATGEKVVETKVTVSNTGEVASAATQLNYLLVNGSESLVGTVDVAALEAGASENYWDTINLEDALTTGDYTLKAVVDPDNAVTEENDDNNESTLGFSYVASGVDMQGIPADFALNQNYPNPFNPQTSISYALPKTSDVKLVISNIHGQVIRVLVNKTVEAGNHEVIWDGTNQFGDKVATGVYFYQISAGSFKELRKMILVQ